MFISNKFVNDSGLWIVVVDDDDDADDGYIILSINDVNCKEKFAQILNNC